MGESGEIPALAAALGKREESEELRRLCRAAQEELRGLLRPGLSPEDCGEAFPLAAAWMALAGLAGGGGDGVSAFTAGEVSIRQEAGSDRARALEELAERIMKPYLRDRGFLFRSMRG